MSPDGPGDEAGAWLSIAEAARREGVTPKAIRNRIERGQITWRHAGNRGREVWLPAGDGPGTEGDEAGDGPGTEAEIAELRASLAEARERAARAEGELVGMREALAEARGRSRAAEAMLAAALRPWWRRWLDRDRSPGRSPDVS